MAKKQEKKTVLERTYNVPLRKEFLKAPRWKRTPKAAKALKMFISRHMKSENVKIGKYANMELWKHGMKNPPHHIKVEAVKDEDGLVRVELVGAPKEKPELKPAKKGKSAPKPEAKPEEKPKDVKSADEEKKGTKSAKTTDMKEIEQPEKQPAKKTVKKNTAKPAKNVKQTKKK